MNAVTLQELKDKIEAVPRARFAQLPTPLEEMPRLSSALGGPRLFIKRDDCTGLAFGGNKTRQFEFAIGDALDSGCDTIVTGAASQSNHCRQAAAACSRLGLACHLVLREDALRYPLQGNLLLMNLLGARLRFVQCELGPELDVHKQALAEELQAQGRRPYVLSSERGNPPNATGYVNMVVELEEQLAALGVSPTRVYICSAGPTGAGLQLAARILSVAWKAVLISPIVWPFPTEERMAHIARGAARYLNVETDIGPEHFDVRFDYVGPAYGVMTPQSFEAIQLLARTEGIVVDPVYSGKCLAGLIDHIRTGALTRDDTVVFVHTGGTPALFAHASEIEREMEAK